MSPKNWGGFCFIDFCQRNDGRPSVRVVQCLKNRDAVKARINVHNRQIDIIQPKSKNLEAVAVATRRPDAMSRFCRRFGNGSTQAIIVGNKQHIRFHRNYFNHDTGFLFSNIANVVAKIALCPTTKGSSSA
jgi:hypothetical protein